jgi:alpha-tubulin suppressor-like RCC1 family protein
VAELDVGFDSTCVVLKDGALWCWGADNTSQSDAGAGNLQPVQEGGLPAAVTTASVAFDHSCAVDTNGALWCWGANDHGQLGNGTTDPSASPLRVDTLGSSVRTVAVGGSDSCAILDDGTLYCWGNNSSGTIGDATSTDRHEPVQVPGLPGKVTQVATRFSTCAVVADGSLWCWGENDNGLLGVPTTDPGYNMGQAWTRSPARVTALGEVLSVVEAGSFRCALKKDASISCWGDNAFGQLGRPLPGVSDKPLQVDALGKNVAQVAVGGSHACAVKTDRTLWCWGGTGWGEVGVKTQSAEQDSPVQIAGIGAHLVAVGAGVDYTCALADDGTVWCWGHNDHGQLGNGTTKDSVLPVKVKLACP